MTNGAERLHAIDAVRGLALLLGIVLHSSLSFVSETPQALWPIADVRQSSALSITAFFIHIFRLPVFFLIAGMLARVLLQRRGPEEFWRNRSMRILVPLIVAWPLCFGAVAAVALWMLARTNGGEVPETIPDELANSGLSFLHLWFLYLLLWLYPLALLLRAMVKRMDADWVGSAESMLGKLLTAPATCLLLAIPVAVALYAVPNWVWSGGVPTPGYSFIPTLAPLLIYGYLFALGWMLDRHRQWLGALSRQWLLNFCIGTVAALACLKLVVLFEVSPAGAVPPGAKLCYAATYAAALVCWTLAAIGAGVRFLSTARPVVRYLADASYWMYLAHLPLVMALQVSLMFVNTHWALKFLLINLVACALLLLSYHYWVRPTWVGVVLNGRRYPRHG